MFFYRKFIPGLAIYSYMIGDEKTKACVVIDPSLDLDDFINIAQENGLSITHILETHVHADFISGSRVLKQRLNAKPAIYCSSMGGKEWIPAYADHKIKNGDQLKLGEIRLVALHTPGHTPEHLCWLLFDEAKNPQIPIALLSGDCLFVGSVGRPDLFGPSETKELAKQLYHTLFSTLQTLPAQTQIFPAHGAGSLCGKAISSNPSTTWEAEKQSNPSLKQLPEEEWIKQLLHDMPEAPPYFSRVKQINKKGTQLMEKPTTIQPLTIQQVKNHLEKERAILLDLRSKENFAFHIPGSISLPFNPNLATWAGWILAPDLPLILVLDDPNQAEEVIKQLRLIGFDQVLGYLDGGFENWKKSGHPIEQIETISVDELAKRINSPNPPLILDVRTDAEWEKNRIEKAVHIPMQQLPKRIQEVPKNRAICTICGSGFRASIAASLLKKEGHEKVANVMGGMTAWESTQQ